jgi:hypothetical protein
MIEIVIQLSWDFPYCKLLTMFRGFDGNEIEKITEFFRKWLLICQGFWWIFLN